MRLTATVAPRSTWNHCGSLGLLDQRVEVVPSTPWFGGKPAREEEAVAGLFSAKLEPLPGVGVRVGVLVGPDGVFVRVGVEVGVLVAAPGVFVRVGVLVGPLGVEVAPPLTQEEPIGIVLKGV